MALTYNVSLKDRASSDKLRARLGIVSTRECIQKHSLRWFEHVERMDDDCWVKKSRLLRKDMKLGVDLARLGSRL